MRSVDARGWGEPSGGGRSRRPVTGVRLGFVFALVATGCLAFAGSASAMRIVVRNEHNAGHGSLRRAIARAKPGDKIVVPAGSYKLTSGELLIDKSLTIEGRGASRTIVNAQGRSRVFEISSSSATVE